MNIKRMFSIGLLILICTGLIFAAGSKEGDTIDEVTLRVATYHTVTDRAKGLPSVIEKYEEMNPHISIDLWATATGYHEAIRTQFSAGEAPDITGTTHDRFLDYAAKGLLFDLTDMFYQNGLDKSLYGLCVGWGGVGDKIYGIAGGPAPIEWFYNVEIFEELGLSEPTTKEEMMEISKTIKEAGYIPLLWGAQDTWTGLAVLGMLTAQTMGLDPVNSAIKSNEWQLEELRESLEIIKEFKESGVIDTDMTGIGYDGSVEMFVNGKVAMFPMGSWVISNFESTKPAGFQYSSFTKPVLFTDNPYALWSASGGQLWTIPKDSEYTDEAVDFLLHLFSEESQTTIAKEGNLLSSVIAANTGRSDDSFKLVLTHLDETNEHSGMLIDYIPSSVKDPLGIGIRSLINGEMTIDEIIASLGN